MDRQIDAVQDGIIGMFSLLDGWLERYELIIELGRELPPLAEERRTEEAAVGGCQSTVWIDTVREEGRIRFHADSDSLIVKGILHLLLMVLDGREDREIREADLYFLEKTGLHAHLSPSRQNGLLAILDRMKAAAGEACRDDKR